MGLTSAFEELIYFINRYLNIETTEVVNITFNLDMKINETEKN